MVKKTNHVILSFALIFIIILLSNVSAYQRLCLTDGDAIPSKQNPMFTCRHDRCEVCVTENNYPTHPGYCNEVTGCNIWGTSGNSSLDTQPPVLTVTSPKNDGVYPGRLVLFDLLSDEPAGFYYMNNDDQRSGWKMLMNKLLSSYKKELSLKDGMNDITIKAVDKSGNIATINRKFYVDSAAPKIKSVSPTKGFSDGKFIVQFTEQNPKILTLYYGNSQKGQKTFNVPIANACTVLKGTYTCEASVSLSEYNSQSIQYYFVLEDIAKAKAQSKTITLQVDTTAPIINNPNSFYTQNGKFIQYSLVITENNFKEVSVLNHNDRNPRWVKICSSLKNSKCEKKASYAKGSHDVDVKVIDAAGNSVTKNIKFDVA